MKIIEFTAMPRIEKGEEVWEPFIHILDRWAFRIGKYSKIARVNNHFFAKHDKTSGNDKR